jgi:hypothetical protein
MPQTKRRGFISNLLNPQLSSEMAVDDREIAESDALIEFAKYKKSQDVANATFWQSYIDGITAWKNNTGVGPLFELWNSNANPSVLNQQKGAAFFNGFMWRRTDHQILNSPQALIDNAAALAELQGDPNAQGVRLNFRDNVSASTPFGLPGSFSVTVANEVTINDGLPDEIKEDHYIKHNAGDFNHTSGKAGRNWRKFRDIHGHNETWINMVTGRKFTKQNRNDGKVGWDPDPNL